MGVTEAGDGMQHLTVLEVQHVDCLIGLRRGEEPLPRDIHRHVVAVRTSRYLRHFNRLYQNQRWLLREGEGSTEKAQCKQIAKTKVHGKFLFNCSAVFVRRSWVR